MGDADNTDNTQVIAPAEMFEEWMDEVFYYVDDSLGSLVSFISVMNERTAYILSELDAWQKFRRCFTALNLFAIPVVLAIGIAYFTKEAAIHDPVIEAALQMLVMILMYLSTIVGLPVYLYSVWDTYFKDDDQNKRRPLNPRLLSGRNFLFEEDEDVDDQIRDLLLPLAEGSSEKLIELTKIFDNSILHNFRRDLERRRIRHQTPIDTAGVEDQENLTGFPEAGNDEETNISSVDAKISSIPETLQEVFRTEEKDFCGVRVIIVNSNPDLTVGLGRKEDTDTEDDEVTEDQGKASATRIQPGKRPHDLEISLVQTIGDYEISEAEKYHQEMVL